MLVASKTMLQRVMCFACKAKAQACAWMGARGCGRKRYVNRIRKARKARGLSQFKLAVLSGLSLTTINQAERSRGALMSEQTALRLAGVLGVEAADLSPTGGRP